MPTESCIRFESMPLQQQRGWLVRAHSAASTVTFTDVLASWLSGDAGARNFVKLITAVPERAVFWEHPVIDPGTLSAPFECVLLDAPALAERAASPDAFAEHFSGPEAVIDFPNWGGDALLIAPSPPIASQGVGPADYGHLLSFLRTAPESQVLALFQRTGERVLQLSRTAPVWLSTSGLGVQWLHLRLDTTPKYYCYAPYARAQA